MLGLPLDKVVAHVIEGGGSFGRRLFADAAFEAAAVSKAVGKPVRLQWHRDRLLPPRPRAPDGAPARARSLVGQGDRRVRPAAHERADRLHARARRPADLARLEAARRELRAVLVRALLPHGAEPVRRRRRAAGAQRDLRVQRLQHVSTRNVYGPDSTTARELIIDKLARELRQGPARPAHRAGPEERIKAVLERVAKRESGWGRRCRPAPRAASASTPSTRAASACVAEIDCRPETVNRKVRDALTGPRVTRSDLRRRRRQGGQRARRQGADHGRRARRHRARADASACTSTTATSSRAAGTTRSTPASGTSRRGRRHRPAADDRQARRLRRARRRGGDGRHRERLLARATGTMPTEFPILHDRADLGFVPQPTVPPLPPQKSDGLSEARRARPA